MKIKLIQSWIVSNALIIVIVLALIIVFLLVLQCLCFVRKKKAIQKSSEEYRKLLELNNSLQKSNDELSDNIARLKEEKPSVVFKEILDFTRKDEESKMEQDIFNIILQNPSKVFSRSNSILSPNESPCFFSINQYVNKTFNKKNTEYRTYYVFPQVSLHALIDSNPKSVNDSVDYLLDHILHPYWFQDLSLNAQKSLVRKLRSYAYISKSIDFLVCECRPAAKKFNNENVWYTYQPIIAIELDGASHSEPVYGKVAKNNQEHSDQMKDAILKGIGVPLIRHTLNSNTITPRDYGKIKNRVYEMLSQYEILSQIDA